MSPHISVLEPLEPRLAPAGVVTASVTGGVLKLTGDPLGNELTITEISPDVMRITGLNGTTISIGGAPGVSTLDVPNVDKGITADLLQGQDIITVQNAAFTGEVKILLGIDNNTANLNNVVVGGNLTVTGLDGNDTVGISGSNVSVRGTTAINLGNGNNSLTLSPSDAIVFDKGFSYIGGVGSDNLSFSGDHLNAGGAFSVNVGAGGGSFSVSASEAINIKGAFSFTSLDHVGTSYSVSLSGGSVIIGGALTVKHGAGSNTTSLSGSDLLQVNGALSVTNGDSGGGSSSTSINGSSNLFVTGALSITNGSGVYSNSIGGSAVFIGGKLSIANGNTSSTTNTSISGTDFDIRGGLTIANKSGPFSNSLSYSQLNVPGAITITNLDTGGSSSTSNSFSGSTLTIGSLSITNGVGSFNNSISPSSGNVTGNVTIKNGNNTSSSTSTSIGGTLHVGGNVSIVNGSGVYDNDVGTGTLLRVGGGISITNGASTGSTTNDLNGSRIDVKGSISIINGDGSVSVNLTASNLIVGGSVNVTNGNHSSGTVSNRIGGSGSADINGSITIKNGNGIFSNEIICSHLDLTGGLKITNGIESTGTIFNTLEIDNARIGGAISITTAGANTETSISGGIMEFGSLSVTNGNGEDAFELQYLNLLAKGAIAFKHGEGPSETSINCGNLTINGAVSVSASTGSDLFSLVGQGQVTGSVTASFGVGTVAGVVIGSLGSELTVTGPINFTADATTSRALNLVRANIGALTFTGGSAGDSIAFSNCNFKGAVKMDLLGGADTMTIDDCNFRNSFTYLGGAGGDSLTIEVTTTAAPGTRFEGAVSVLMGADNDTISLAAPTNANRIIFFGSTVNIQGEAGSDAITQGANITFTVTPTINL